MERNRGRNKRKSEEGRSKSEEFPEVRSGNAVGEEG